MSIIAEALKKAQEERSVTKKTRANVRNEFVANKPCGPTPGKVGSGDRPPVGRIPLKGILSGVQVSNHSRALLILAFSVLLASIPLSFLLFYIWDHPRHKVEIHSSTLQNPAFDPVRENTSEKGDIPRVKAKRPEEALPATNPEQVHVKEPDITFPEVSGIMYNSEKPRAVVNGVLCSEGDLLGSTRIVRILPQSVIVIIGEEEQEISLR